jgi:glucosylceramidase
MNEYFKEDALSPSRRDFLKAGAAGIALLSQGYVFGSAAGSKSEIDVRLTASSARFAARPAIQWQSGAGLSSDTVVLDSTKAYQEVLSVGSALTEAACYMFNRLTPELREQIFHELYHPSEMGFGVCRTCIGASDYATVAYSYDDGDPDPELLRFSIDHERGYVLPMLRLARKVNPELYVFGAPWSPPGWMKANGSMLGGSMRKHNLAAHARYFVKYLQAYPPRAWSGRSYLAERGGYRPRWAHAGVFLGAGN